MSDSKDTPPKDGAGAAALTPESLRGENFFDLDVLLQQNLERASPGVLDRWGDMLQDFGVWVGSDVDEEAEYTDRYGHPVLAAYDRDGNTINRIIKNPAWNKVADEVYRRGIVGLNYAAEARGEAATGEDGTAPFSVTFAMNCLLSQTDMSMACPVTMTHSVAYVIDRFAPADVRARYLPQLTTTKGGVRTGGTWATEQHGGSDVGATTTVARRDGDHFRLTGLKWFVSNADGGEDGGIALATARPDPDVPGNKGLGLYVVPTHLADGSPNSYRIRRLKDKLGTHGVPTAEIELDDAFAEEVAAPPDGLRIMMEALGNSRIHTAVGASGIQWRAFAEARAFAKRRMAFGQHIDKFPMVQDELLKMLVGVEVSYALTFEACRMFDAAMSDDGDKPWMRLSTALAKYLAAETSIQNTKAAMELIGGNAYTYDYVLPRLLRDAQVNSIWEGPANIQALEILRMLGNRQPGFEAYTARIEGILGKTPAGLEDIKAPLARAWAECMAAAEFVRGDATEANRHARRLMHMMAEVLGGALLLEQAAEDIERGDGRKAMIARKYIETCFAPPPRGGVIPGQDWMNKHFDALVWFGEISPADD